MVDLARKSTEGLLQSVLISSAGGVPLHKLKKEYKDVTMQDLPFELLGYSSVEQYIKSIPHCAFVTQDKDGVMVVRGIASQENKHVARLVSGQKKTKKKKSRFLSERPLYITRKSVQPPSHFRSGTNFAFGNRATNYQFHSAPLTAAPHERFIHHPAMQFKPPVSLSSTAFGKPAFTFADSKKRDNIPKYNFPNPSIPSNKPASYNFNKPGTTVFDTRKTEGATSKPSYQLPPRMKKLQENPNDGNGFNDSNQTKQLESNDLRFTITKKRMSGNVVSDVNDVLKNNVIQMLQPFNNGLWGDILKKKYKEKYGDCPEDILDILNEDTQDRFVLNNVSQGKAIVSLKMEVPPSPARKVIVAPDLPKVDSAMKSNKNDKLDDIRVVISRNKGSTREIINLIEEEEVLIPDQYVPVEGEIFEAYVCHVDSIHRFFIHKADSEIIQLSESMQGYYENAKNSTSLTLMPKIGMWCCASYESQWYRGKIILAERLERMHRKSSGRKNSSSKKEADSYNCKIQYIDYGNLETVNSNDIKKLKADFCKLPPQAMQCKLSGITLKQVELSEEAKNYLINKTADTLVQVKVTSVKDKIVDVELSTGGGQRVANDLVDTGYAVFEGKRRPPLKTDSAVLVPEMVETDEICLIARPQSSILQRLSSLSIDEDEDMEVMNVELPEEKYVDVLVSTVDNFNEISVILRGNEYLGRLTVLQEAMHRFFDNEQQENLDSVEIDALYAASLEEAWHRIRVLDIKDDEIDIELVDRGDHSTVKRSNLRKLPAQFKRLPLQAITLNLSNLPESDNQEYIQEISDMILGKECVAAIVDGSADIPIVNMYDTSGVSDININEVIIKKLGLAEEQNYEHALPQPGEQLDTYVTHISDQGVFYIIVPGAGVRKLDQLIDDLTNYFTKGSKAADFVKKLETDKICCTKWKEDGLLYRVMITCVMEEEQKVEIEFIDHGNRDVVPFSALKEIPEKLKDLLTLPHQVAKCQLANLAEECRSMWQNGLSQRLAAELKTQTVIFKVIDPASEDKHATVEIFKTDPADETKLIPIDKEIRELSTPSRNESSASLTSSGSDADEKQKIEMLMEDAKHENLNLVSNQAQLSSFSSTDSDSMLERHKHEVVSTPSLSLRNATVPDLQIGSSWVTAHVTVAHSPSKFYFQMQNTLDQLIHLIESMSNFYEVSEDCFEDCEPGDICAVYLPDEDLWYRCVVRSRIEIEEQVQIFVFFVDFGDLLCVPAGNVRQLDTTFLYLPFQAIHASLSGTSSFEHKKWGKKDIKKFAELVTGDKLFRAQIMCPDASYPLSYPLFPAKKALSVRLYDTRKKDDVSIDDLIVAQLNAAQ